jgi:hypothetical protein
MVFAENGMTHQHIHCLARSGRRALNCPVSSPDRITGLGLVWPDPLSVNKLITYLQYSLISIYSTILASSRGAHLLSRLCCLADLPWQLFHLHMRLLFFLQNE